MTWTKKAQRIIRPRADLWRPDVERDLLRHACVNDFWSFFNYAMGFMMNPRAKWLDPVVHRPFAEWFQQHIEEWQDDRDRQLGKQKHLAILVHREVGKTTFMNAGQLWLHVRDPEISTYTGGEKVENAQKSLATIKAHMDGSDPYSRFVRLFGNWSTDARRWTGTEIVHSARKNTARRDPSLGIFAVETSIVGAHPDAIFYDDPISYERLASDRDWLDRVKDQVGSLYPVVQGDGLVVWLGTRYSPNDHFGEAFKIGGVKSVTGMPTDTIDIREDGQWHVFFMAGRHPDGTPSTPRVWPEQRLKSYERDYPVLYASQIMNDPSLSETNPLTLDMAKNQCMIAPDQVPWAALRYAIATDLALWDGRSRTKMDESVMVVHGYPRNGSGDVYVIECRGSRTWRGEDFAKNLLVLVQRYRRLGRQIMGISDEIINAASDAWPMALKNYFNEANEPMPRYVQIRRSGEAGQKQPNKITRIEKAAQFWVDGHVKVVKDAPGVMNLVEQMSQIEQMKTHPKMVNDYADAHADAFIPEFYQGMRRPDPKTPWMPGRGVQALRMDGLDWSEFDGPNEGDAWTHSNPRPPIR